MLKGPARRAVCTGLAVACCAGLSGERPAAAARQQPVFTTGTPAEIDRARALAEPHLADLAARRGVDELRVTRIDVDPLSTAHVRSQQYLRGIPVFGGEAIVHLRSDGTLSSLTDGLLPNVRVDTTPRLVPGDAIARAVAHVGRQAGQEHPGADLWILRRDGTDRLVYRVAFTTTASGGRPSRPVVFVAADDGAIVWTYDNLQTGARR